MDPNTLMAVILDGFAVLSDPKPYHVRPTGGWSSYTESTSQALRDLADWIEKGGFPPCKHEWPEYTETRR